MDRYICPNGHGPFTVGKRVFGKLGGALVGATAGGATRNPLAVLFGTLLGGFIGHLVDEAILPSCPICGEILRLIDEGFSY